MQGFNMGRYYPPDATDAPTFNSSSHPLGKRANKISQGILKVRFELPFAVWCDHCTPAAIVGQGVRFNAEKKKVGNYHSTPIWSFRMKHSACGGWWEIRTDPKNSEYVVFEGAKRRDYGPEGKDEEAEGDLKLLTQDEKDRRRNDAFANLEGKIEDKGNENKNKERVEELYAKSEIWRDPYEVNAKLRQEFRARRKIWEKAKRHTEGMQDKFSLGIDIVEETPADRMHASMIDFGGSDTGMEKTVWNPLFDTNNTEKKLPPSYPAKTVKLDKPAESSRRDLQRELVGNTRAKLDPFASSSSMIKTQPTFSALKRKRDVKMEEDAQTGSEICVASSEAKSSAQATVKQRPALSAALVGYDSE